MSASPDSELQLRPTPSPAPESTVPVPLGDICAVFGATGACGSNLVEELLGSPEIGQVYCFTRRPTTKHLKNPKYKEVLLTGNLLEDLETKFPQSCDVVFSGLATTIKQAGSEEKMRAIDYGMNMTIAKFAREERNVPQYYLISSAGSDANSRFFYLRMKGELENAIQALNFPRSVILRPSVLMGADRPEFRFGEWILANLVAPVWCFTTGWLGSIAPINVRDVAKSMATDYIAHRHLNTSLREKYQIETTTTKPLPGQFILLDGSAAILSVLTKPATLDMNFNGNDSKNAAKKDSKVDAV